MRYFRWVLWGAITGVDLLGLALVVTMFCYCNSVLYWLWDTTDGVWYFAAGGAMLGLSFAYSTRNSKKVRFVNKTNPPGVSWGRVLITRVSSLSLSVKGFKNKRG